MKEFSEYIFGSVYTFRVGTAEELGIDIAFSGDTDVQTKVIRIRTDVDKYHEPGRAEYTCKKTLIHEVFHATLYETGLLDYFDNETLAQWFEVMFPKLEHLISNIGKALDNALAHLLET